MPKKKGRVVRGAGELARKASKRQRKLYGLKWKPTDHERWRLEIDEKYAADLAKDPEAALFLSQFNEEMSRGTYARFADEPRLHDDDELRALDRERKHRANNPDVLSFGAYRGPSLEDADTVGEDPGSWLAEQTGVRPGDVEDALIESLDRKRAVALRVRPTNDE